MRKEQRKPGLLPGGRILRSLLVAVLWLAIWQTAYWLVRQDLLLASPVQVIVRFFQLFFTGEFWLTASFSLLRITTGFTLGMVLGSILAIATCSIKWMHAIFYPAVSAIRATPVSSFIILALVWMSSGRVVVFIVFLMVLPIAWANVSEGITGTDRKLLQMAQVYQLRKIKVWRYIYLPSVSPFFMSAATTGLGLGWKAGVAAEVLSTPRYSLGGRLYEAKIYLETTDLMAYTMMVIVLSLILEKLLIRALRRAEISLRGQRSDGDSK